MTRSVCICVTGWHFRVEVYEKLSHLTNSDIYVIYHKPLNAIPSEIYEFIPQDHMIIRPNYGYDWGCYQQFLETDIWRDYEYIVFMHDDIQILRDDFIEAAIALFSDNIILVGNGRNNRKLNWVETHLFCYAHSEWIPPSKDFQHDTARGSFFVMQKKTLEKMGKFEVMWDKYSWSLGFGNWSLIASCGKLHDLFGFPCFAFLSDDYLRSQYLLEDERGRDKNPSNTTWLKSKSTHLYTTLCRKYVELRQAKQFSVRYHILKSIIRRTASVDD